MPLYIRENEVEQLLPATDAVDAVDGCFQRIARGAVDNRSRFRIKLEGGVQHTMAAADLELGLCGLKTYVGFAEGANFVVVLFAVDRPEAIAIIEADRLGQRRTGAASGVAARYLAKSDARSLGVIGCGWQAESQVQSVRAAVPGIEEVRVYCRDEDRRKAFAKSVGGVAVEYNKEAAETDIVIAATTSKDPVLRGEWLQPGALVCAIGANRIRARELDNAVLERASFVCCDSREQCKIEAGDLAEPVEQGILDWLEVHELSEIVSGEISGRANDDDIVVFKSVGIAAEDLAVGKLVVDRAREQGLGVEL
ncbi:MAG: ornithine cyclodeaminase family protein [Gaiellaceae bacterium]